MVNRRKKANKMSIATAENKKKTHENNMANAFSTSTFFYQLDVISMLVFFFFFLFVVVVIQSFKCARSTYWLYRLALSLSASLSPFGGAALAVCVFVCTFSGIAHSTKTSHGLVSSQLWYGNFHTTLSHTAHTHIELIWIINNNSKPFNGQQQKAFVVVRVSII